MKENIIKFNATYDLVFKNVFKDEEILKDFLTSILGKGYDLSKLRYTNIEENNSLIYKSSSYDIKIEMIGNHGKTKGNIDLEMQRNKPNYDIIRRALYYQYQLGTSCQIKGKDDYKDITTISIFLLNFNIFDDTICMKDFSYYNKESNKHLADDKIIIIELKKFKYLEENNLKQWVEILIENKLQRLKGASKIMDKAIDTIEILNADEAFLKIIESENRKERDYKANLIASERKGLEKGEKRGIAKGENKKAIEVAKNMLNADMDINQIAVLTGLSVEKINKLK